MKPDTEVTYGLQTLQKQQGNKKKLSEWKEMQSPSQSNRTALAMTLSNSVCQTDSALSNLSLNIHGHVEVPKAIFFRKKSCLSAVINLYL